MQSTTSSTRTFITPPAKDKKADNEPKQRKSFFGRRYLPWIIVVLLILVTIFLYWQYDQAQKKLEVGSAKYYTEMTTKLGKLIILPNEKPVIVTVKNASIARKQEFYKNANNGDITFVYNQAHKAILYRPNDNIIVNVAPVNISSAK